MSQRKRCFVLDPHVPGRVLAYISTKGATKVIGPDGEGLPRSPLLDGALLLATGEFAYPRFWVQVPLDRLVHALPELPYFQTMMETAMEFAPKKEVFVRIHDIPHEYQQELQNTYEVSVEVYDRDTETLLGIQGLIHVHGALQITVPVERDGRPPAHYVSSVDIDDFTQQLKSLRGGAGLFPDLRPPNRDDPQTVDYLYTRLQILADFGARDLMRIFNTRRAPAFYPFDIREPTDQMFLFPASYAWQIVQRLQNPQADPKRPRGGEESNGRFSRSVTPYVRSSAARRAWT